MVKEFLGEGARKKVYLCHDTLLDRDVAFAVIKTEGLDETGRQRILREAQTMGRLGEHPNIVQLFDLGDERGQPYMVMPVMSGGDVQGLMGGAPDRRLPLEQAISIAENVCLGLEFAHSQGVVHRDLKPGNVWLTADGAARIGDFGLAVSMDSSRLTSEGMMMGTVAYMPPEQAVGQAVDERSDLYSLGAMLYEMVTGRPPFLGDDPVAIIGQHVNTPPVAPTWHNSACPRPLEALVLRLLSKDPAERPGSAADVLTALEGVDLSASVEGRSESEARSLDSLASGVFVGRQREMGELKAALEDALGGHGRLVMLTGQPGIGNTRTAQELTTYAGLRRTQVLWGRCYEEQGMPPYWPWIQAIRGYVREKEPDELRSEMGSGAADIAEVVSEVRERLPDLEPSPELESPEAARFRLFDSITSFLKSAGQRQPLVLVLDDLHWADETSLLLLQFLSKELGNARLMVLGTYRDMELSRQHPLAETLGELTRSASGGFQRILLRGLTLADEETAQILYGLGRAQAGVNQVDEAVSSFTGAFDYYAESGDTSRAVAVAEYGHSIGMAGLMEDIIARALRLVPSDSHEAGRLLSTYGFSVAADERFADAQEAFDRAVAIAVREGDTALEMRTLANNAQLAGFNLRWDECLEKGLRAIELAGVGGDAIYEMRARLWVCHALLAKGQAEEIEPHATAVLEQADRLRDRYWIGLASYRNSTISAAQGDWRAMRSHSDRGLEAFPTLPTSLIVRALEEQQVGESELGEVYLERHLTAWSSVGTGIGGLHLDAVLASALVARITGNIDRFEFVQETAGQVLASPRSVRGGVVSVRIALGLIAVSRGEASVAHEQYAALGPYRGTMSGYCGLVSTDRILVDRHPSNEG